MEDRTLIVEDAIEAIVAIVDVIRRHDGEAVDDLNAIVDICRQVPEIADRVVVGAAAHTELTAGERYRIDDIDFDRPTEIEGTLNVEHIGAISRICFQRAEGRKVVSVESRLATAEECDAFDVLPVDTHKIPLALVDVEWSELADAGHERMTRVRYAVTAEGLIDDERVMDPA